MPDTINRNRGVFERRHPDGPWIVMYRDEPGVYRFVGGKECSDAEAKEAGFDVEAGRLEKRKRELMAEKEREINEQFKDAEREVAERAAAEAVAVDWVAWEGEGANRVTKRNADHEPRETERLRMEHFGAGLWNVIDKADSSVVLTKVPKEEAMLLLKEGV